MSHDLENFDWVKARAECSLFGIFLRLRSNAEEDVANANEIFKDIHRRFGFVSDAKSFTVFEDVSPRRNVTFKLNADNISVSNGRGKEQFSATLTLNKDRECRLLVGEEEMDLWFFRKKALEALFFLEP
jgi:hypothetical protein